ncbi:transposase [Gammaproteobacteria bacterium]|nr:transposase [Gammaproteobacteria bacterium]
MPNYRRNFIRGGTYLFTVVLADRKSCLLTNYFDCLRVSIRRTRKSYPFCINSWVVLPEHLHCIWTLPEGDSDYPKRWRAIKTYFCIEMAKTYPDATNKKVWQRGYWEHTIKSERDFKTHMDYVHINPLKHGYVNRVKDWPYSSFHHLVSKGVYSEKWGDKIDLVDSLNFGE